MWKTHYNIIKCGILFEVAVTLYPRVLISFVKSTIHLSLLFTLIGLLILTGCESEKKEESKQVVETNGMLSYTIDGEVAKDSRNLFILSNL